MITITAYALRRIKLIEPAAAPKRFDGKPRILRTARPRRPVILVDGSWTPKYVQSSRFPKVLYPVVLP